MKLKYETLLSRIKLYQNTPLILCLIHASVFFQYDIWTLARSNLMGQKSFIENTG